MRLGITLRDITAGAPHTVYAPTGGNTPPMAGAGNPGFTAPKPQEGGFFRQGGMGRTLAGIIGDTLLQQSGMAPVYAPMQQARQQEKQAEVMWDRRRQAENQDWMARQQWERANPAPRQPDAFDIALQRGGIDPNSEQGQQMYRDRAASMARDPNDQFVTVNIPGVGTYAGPQSGLPGFTGTAPQRPVGQLTPVDPPARPLSAPQMTVSPRELDALVRRYGPQAVQARIDSGEVAVRSN